MVKAKTQKKTKEAYKVYLLYESSTYGGEVSPSQEGEEWPSHEPEHTTFTPKGLRLKAPEWSETIKVDFDPSGSEHLYVVVVRYSSGSTFGTSHGHWHIEGAYKTYDEAEKIEMAISKRTGKYEMDKGHCLPWEGYFESLEGVIVERLDVWK